MKQLRWGILMAALIIAVTFGANADAERIYSVTVPVFSGGLDFETGTVYNDPTVLIVTFGEYPEIEEIWKPSMLNWSDFGEASDAIFDFETNMALSMNLAPQHIINIAALPNSLSDTPLLPSLLFNMPSEEIALDDHDTLVLLTANHTLLKIGNFVRLPDFKVKFDVATITITFERNVPIPEPTTLTLFILSFIGLLGVIRTKRHKSSSLKRFILFVLTVELLNVSLPADAQTFSCDNVTEVPKAECNALVSLYNNTNGANWTNKTGWLQTNTPCSWYGIGCGKYQESRGIIVNHITKIELIDNQLHGNIPFNIDKFSYLHDLNLSFNTLQGTLPQIFLKSTWLYNINLEWNQLSGNLPSEIGSTIYLRSLDLSNNQFSGDLPSEIGNLTYLTLLDLNTNQFTGELPQSLGKLSRLSELYLQKNQFYGNLSQELGNLKNLRTLMLNSNQLTGELPPSLGGLSRLETLYLHNNRFYGQLPTELGSLSSLYNMNISFNQLSGSLPATFGNLTQLGNLKLHNNQLSGTFPIEMKNMKNLANLVLHHNKFSGDLSNLAITANLRYLDVSFNELSGNLPLELQNPSPYDTRIFVFHHNYFNGIFPPSPEVFTNCKNVSEIPESECEALSAFYTETNGESWINTGGKNGGWLQTNTPCNWYGVTCNNGHVIKLVLASNQLTESIPIDVTYLSFLEYLSLGGNRLQGGLPPQLGNLKTLKYIDLSFNPLGGILPHEWEQLTNLELLNLQATKISGELPLSWGKLTNLKTLYLLGNNLTGQLPKEWGHLGKLQAIDLGWNMLVGELPLEWNQLTNVINLSVSHNKLSGYLPLEWNHLPNLRTLRLGYNQFSGTLPPEWGSFVNLEEIELNDNQLEGSLPREWSAIPKLKFLYLSNNRFSGELPAEWGNLSNMREFFLTKNQLQGPLSLNLMNLKMLYNFKFNETNLCEPQDTTFQSWLSSIHYLTRSGIVCSAPPIIRTHTLILTNRQQLANLHGSSAADQVISKLKTFAAHSAVQGLVVQVENDTAVSAKQAARSSDYNNAANANAVADAIKQVIFKEWNAHPELGNIVIVGDDRVIPFYRNIDPITEDASGPLTPPDFLTLTDDFYSSKNPITCYANPENKCANPELFIPDVSIGRLVESPAQIIGQIDAFLSGQNMNLRQGVVTGYDMFRDAAQYQCATLTGAQVASDCSLIGATWASSAFRAKVLSTPHDVVSLNNHADYNGFGAPDGGFLSDAEIAAAATDFSRAIWYSTGCHAGKNLAESLDLPESLSSKRAIYTANTGYGWGLRMGVNYSEKLMWYFTQQLAVGTETTVGKALMQVKQRYYAGIPFLNAIHEKILTESTLYGLPMYRVTSGLSAPAPVNPISVTVQPVALASGLSKETRAYSWALPTPEGGYYALNGNVTDDDGKPVLPVLIDDLVTMADRVHGVVFTGGVYSIVNAAPPLQEVVTTQTTASASSGTQAFDAPGWYPAAFGAFNTLDLLAGRRQTLIATAGQYNPNLAANQQRIFTAMNFEVYAHANSTDFTAPTIASVTSALQGNAATITVQADDPSGIETVVVVYTDGKGAWQSVNLTQSGAAWTGSIPAAGPTEFFVQAVDKAGNVAVDERDGAYYVLPLFTVRKAAKNSGTGLIMLGKERCEADCAEVSVPVSLTTTLIIKAVASPDSRFVGWERLDGTPIAQHNLRAKPGDTVIAVFERKK
ncbi:leucine rich repeat domain protein [Candidatus Moduliflexus flocculans]|uniref:Leucine rich repeat domain protein n=1 Tax=Candidatus Moduliflexus flocculans TaxID=1499966 RepID=A0A0S6VXP2_9BACT|nr:leucine rich repeat domain protein [Candidatus Moduliflexus flocculans]